MTIQISDFKSLFKIVLTHSAIYMMTLLLIHGKALAFIMHFNIPLIH